MINSDLHKAPYWSDLIIDNAKCSLIRIVFYFLTKTVQIWYWQKERVEAKCSFLIGGYYQNWLWSVFWNMTRIRVEPVNSVIQKKIRFGFSEKFNMLKPAKNPLKPGTRYRLNHRLNHRLNQYINFIFFLDFNYDFRFYFIFQISN